MWWIRCFGHIVLPCFAAVALLLTGAFAQQTPQTPPPSQPAKAPVSPPAPEVKAPTPDEKAVKTLKVAAEMLDAKKLGWFQTTLWQRVESNGLSYESEGTYACGPGMRMRLDLEVQLGKTKGHSTMVSDGTTVWSSIGVGTNPPSVSRWDVKRINEVLSAPGASPLLRQKFFRDQFFAGLAPLIQSLEQHMVFTKQELENWKGHEVYLLTGIPPESAGKQSAPWPLFVPRKCRCFFDKVTLWPLRLEWWGPVAIGSEDAILTQMEFRDPKFYKGDSVPPELGKSFQFDAGKTPVVDQTQEMTNMLARQSMMPTQPPAGSSK